MTLNNPGMNAGSSYRDTFVKVPNKQKAVAVESCKPKQNYNPTHGKMKYKTEYNGQYIEQPINQKKAFDCLSPQELKSYVMNILND